jgi:16S rRNA G966 N2-methylase RsmD
MISIADKKRKYLGQYFTNIEISKYIIDKCNIPNMEMVKIIDPMCGSGNMLIAAAKKGAKNKNVYGIEIDKEIIEKNPDIARDFSIINGDAFDLKTYENIGYEGWDLVITNPPYVRYQTTSNTKESYELEPEVIRKNLYDIIVNMTHITSGEKDLYKKVINEYSGLSDLAVPAWILCMALTKVNGRFAIILPDSWINREYAVKVIYSFIKIFKIQYILEDIDCSLFNNAQVKTNIIIATKREKIIDIKDIYNEVYEIGKIKAEHGLNDTMFDTSSMKPLIGILERNSGQLKTYTDCSFFSNKVNSGVEGLLERIGIDSKVKKIVGLSKYGINVGQGLRTGANKFFYLECIQDLGNLELLQADKVWNMEPFILPKTYLYKTIKNQNDLPDGYKIEGKKINNRLLYIENVVTTNDWEACNDLCKIKYELMTPELNEYVLKAQDTPINIEGKLKFVYDLSAVKTNVSSKNEMKRFWYMIPSLQDRHKPLLCVPRINYKEVMFYKCDEGLIVDANFSTIWIDDRNLINNYAIFSVFNSIWIRAQLESIATVMGGGALKVEATHIKKLVLPNLDKSELELLNNLGHQLENSSQNNIPNILKKIDKLVIDNLFGIDLLKIFINT